MLVAGSMSDGVNSHLGGGSGGGRYYRPWHGMTRGLISSPNNPLRRAKIIYILKSVGAGDPRN